MGDDVTKLAISVACISQISIFTQMEGTNNKRVHQRLILPPLKVIFAISDTIDCFKHYNSFYDKLT